MTPKIVRARVKVRNRLGLHTRPSQLVVQAVGGRRASLHIAYPAEGLVADGSSIISILSLGAPQDSELELILQGPEADELCKEVRELFESGFGESEGRGKG